METTLATDQDVTAVDTIQHALADQALLPAVHLVDGAYVSSDGLVASQQDYHVALPGPMRQDQSWQAHDDQAFDTSQFAIAWRHEVATGPNGKQSRYGKPATGPRGKPTIQVLFHKKDCAGCAMRTRCTRRTTGPRELTLHPQAQQLALQAARQRQQTDDFTALYKSRAGVEGTISQAVFALGMRRTRSRGFVKTHLQHVATATAMNLQRFVDWLWEVPHSRTYKSPFMRLAPAT